MAKLLIVLDDREQDIVARFQKLSYSFREIEDWNYNDWEEFDSAVRQLLKLGSPIFGAIDYGFLLK